MKYLALIGRITHKVSRFFSWVASISLFLMMFITTVDVVGRYLFNFPVLGTQDMVELALVICVFGALGHATLARGHIRADMLNPVLSKRNNAILSGCSFVLCFVIGVLLTWETGIKAIETVGNLRMVTSTISIPVGPFFAFATFGLFIMTIELAFDTVRYFREALDPNNPKYSGSIAEDDLANM